jgi:hypothetical protein
MRNRPTDCPVEPSWWLTGSALVVVVACHLLAKVGKFPVLRGAVSRWPVRPHSNASGAQVQNAVDHALVWLPIRTHCLNYSAALVIMMRLRGIPAQLIVGVRQRPFEGHAWVEIDHIVMGPPFDRSSFVAIDAF